MAETDEDWRPCCTLHRRAHADFDEDIKGSLRPGKLADITVFSKDCMTIPEDQTPSTEVLYTIVGGTVQYMRERS